MDGNNTAPEQLMILPYKTYRHAYSILYNKTCKIVKDLYYSQHVYGVYIINYFKAAISPWLPVMFKLPRYALLKKISI